MLTTTPQLVLITLDLLVSIIHKTDVCTSVDWLLSVVPSLRVQSVSHYQSQSVTITIIHNKFSQSNSESLSHNQSQSHLVTVTLS